jgi:hypothetical protein
VEDPLAALRYMLGIIDIDLQISSYPTT